MIVVLVIVVSSKKNEKHEVGKLAVLWVELDQMNSKGPFQSQLLSAYKIHLGFSSFTVQPF